MSEIKTIITELLTKTGFSIEGIDEKLDGEIGVTFFDVQCDDPQLLIGRNGDVLRSVNHLVSRFLEQENKESKKKLNFLIDVNGYHNRKINDLKVKARIVTDRARSFKSDISMPPMSAHDRLIIHSFVGKFADLETESSGEGPDRHIVIKYRG